MVFIYCGVECRSFGVEGLHHAGELLSDLGSDVVGRALDGSIGDVDAALVGGVVYTFFPLLVSLEWRFFYETVVNIRRNKKKII